jgi:hypothetical protein
MKFLLFFLGVVFFFIFYLFSQISGVEGFFISNLFWIANIYVFIAILFAIHLMFYSQKNEKHWNTNESKENEPHRYIPSWEESITFIKKVFSQYIYYIACALFYIALYFIMHSLFPQTDLPLLFLLLNSVVIILYFLEHKFEVFKDLVRVNMLLISLYYIVIHALYLFWFPYDFSIVDVINIVAVFFLFFIILSSKKTDKYSVLLWHYCIAFSFLEILTFFKSFMWVGFLSFWFLALLLWTGSLIFTKQIHQRLRFPKKILRAWGVSFLSIFIMIAVFFIWKEDIYSLFLIPLLVFWAWILVEFHNRFQNYWALSMGALGYMWAGYGIYSIVLSQSEEKLYLYILMLLFSWIFLFFEKLSFSPRNYDIYFFHILSLLVNLVWVFCFLFFRDISILSLWILLLIESLYLFVSYYTISNTKKIW